MMSIHDDLFGDLSVEFLSYSGECDVPFFGTSKKFDVKIQTAEDMKIHEAQRAVFADFKMHKELYAQQAENAILHYYLEELEDFRDRFDPETVDENAPIITEVGQLKDLLSWGGVTIRLFEACGKSFGLVYDCSWDEDNGVGVKFVDGLVVEVGPQYILV